MGQYKETAFAARDWNLAKRDLLEDLLHSWDSYDDMINGASAVDRENAMNSLNTLSMEWDGTKLGEVALESFADEYDSALKELGQREY